MLYWAPSDHGRPIMSSMMAQGARAVVGSSGLGKAAVLTVPLALATKFPWDFQVWLVCDKWKTRQGPGITPRNSLGVADVADALGSVKHGD